MDARQYHKRLFDAARSLIPGDTGIVCAVSGGPDSLALLHGLLKVNEAHKCGWSLHVAHLDHRLRGDSSSDAAFITETAESLGLDCTIESVDVKGEARSRGETVEEAARYIRYAFLHCVAKAVGAGVVTAGHHAGDQAETVLHHIARGTGLRGLAGMRESKPIVDGSSIRLVRPLLGFSREDLMQYLKEQELPFRIDPTNEDEQTATRNAIRHQILPLLRCYVNPDIERALVRLSAQASRADAALTQMSEEALSRSIIHRGETVMLLSVEAFATWPRAIQAEMVRAVLRRLSVNMKAIGFERIEAVVDVATTGDGGRRRIELAGGVVVERRGGELRIERQ